MHVEKISLNKQDFLYKHKRKDTTFKSSFRTVYNDNFSLKYNTNTCFFRSDLNWKDFVNYLNTKYKNTQKVNIIDFACSTGEEPYSLAMLLDLQLGKDAEKFFPIRAFDIDEDNIKNAKKGIFSIHKTELDFLENNVEDKYKDYFRVLTDNYGVPVWFVSNDNIESKVIFEQSDMLKDMFKIPSNNTILLCRNVFPYLTIGEESNLVKQISKQLDASSAIVLGCFDISYGIDKLFEKEGFKHTSQYNVMEKLPYHKAVVQNILRTFKIK